MKPRLNRVELSQIQIKNLSAEIGALRNKIDIEADKTKIMIETVAVNMTVMDMKMQTQTQDFNIEMNAIQDLRQTVNIGVS